LFNLLSEVKKLEEKKQLKTGVEYNTKDIFKDLQNAKINKPKSRPPLLPKNSKEITKNLSEEPKNQTTQETNVVQEEISNLEQTNPEQISNPEQTDVTQYWQEYFTENNDSYWYNTVTGESRWEKPF